jgi:ribosomal protein S18 acetylase RimI-like enzyme
MRDAKLFVRQWEGLVAQVRILGKHADGADVVERDGMVAAVMPMVPTSSLMNVAIATDPTATPEHLAELGACYQAAGVAKWGLWVDADHEPSARAAAEQGMVLDSRPQAMVADLHTLANDDDDPPPHRATDLATVGRVNDLAYGFPEPRLARTVNTLPPSVLTYAAPRYGEPSSVAMALDVNTDTNIWFVATLPGARRKGLASGILRRILNDANTRGQQTGSLLASAAGARIYERLGFGHVGTVHLYEERFR